MRNLPFIGSLSPVSALLALNGVLVVCYIALIAFVMSYAALEVEFAQSVKADQANVATLEGTYLASLESITNTDYAALGYAKPLAELYVPGAPRTAINLR